MTPEADPHGVLEPLHPVAAASTHALVVPVAAGSGSLHRLVTLSVSLARLELAGKNGELMVLPGVLQ